MKTTGGIWTPFAASWLQSNESHPVSEPSSRLPDQQYVVTPRKMSSSGNDEQPQSPLKKVESRQAKRHRAQHKTLKYTRPKKLKSTTIHFSNEYPLEVSFHLSIQMVTGYRWDAQHAAQTTMNYIVIGQRLKSNISEDYLSNTVETLALAKLVLHLPGTFLSLLQTAHGTGVLAIAKVDPSHQGVCSLKILQEVVFPEL